MGRVRQSGGITSVNGVVPASMFLDRLDPQAHRAIFAAAFCDPHPQVAEAAKKRVKGQGLQKKMW
ncbi:MAG TPA: hypothetical protein EYG11_15680 [Candidatus Latescibacteria bacterium]|nr:hypothetical protein [Candidatus Handelsmanbacteria bacterium]HIL10139.1 hypothetical protein [Candidatus Latescibacterota bacterium]